MQVSTCYEIKCKLCEVETGPGTADNQPLAAGSQPSPAVPVQIVAGARRSRYVGQSGTTIHRRMVSHRAGLKSKSEKTIQVLRKHMLDVHTPQDQPEFQMKVIDNARSNLKRLVKEGTLIREVEREDPGSLMNSKGEWGRSKLVRFTASVERC